ncbi:MAG: hypothetical protein ACT6QS_10315 [Flavobacteriales bacterium]
MFSFSARRIFSVLFISLSISSFAQTSTLSNPAITIGTSIEYPKKHRKIAMMGNEKDGYIAVTRDRYGYDGYGIYKLDSDFNVTNSALYPFTDPNSLNTYLEGAAEVNGTPYVFYSERTTNPERSLYFQAIDPQTGKAGERTKIIEASTADLRHYQTGGDYAYYSQGYYLIAGVKNNSNIIVGYAEKLADNKGTPYAFNLYTPDFQKIWEQKIVIGGGDGSYKVLANTLRDDEMYIFVRHTLFPNKKTNTKGSDQLIIYHLSEDKNEQYMIDIAPLRFMQEILVTDSGEDFRISGYHSSEDVYTSAGIQTAIIRKNTMELEANKQLPFTEDLIKIYSFEKDYKGLPWLEPKQIFMRSNGGFYLIGEKYHVSRFESRTPEPSIHHIFEDVVISSVNAEGESEWNVRLPKYQYLIDNTIGTGIKGFLFEDQLYVFYLDYPGNRQTKDGEKPRRWDNVRDSDIVLAVISTSGDIEKRYLLPGKNNAGKIIPEYLFELSPGTILNRGTGEKPPSFNFFIETYDNNTLIKIKE